MSKFVIRSETPRDNPEWGSLAWLCSPPSTGNSKLTVIDLEISPGGGHPFHRHADQEELIVVVEGQVEQWLEEEMRVLSAGDSVFIDANTVHATFNTTDSTSKVLAILGPCVGEIGYETEDVSEQAPWSNLRI